jgi:hypothetical protein
MRSGAKAFVAQSRDAVNGGAPYGAGCLHHIGVPAKV